MDNELRVEDLALSYDGALTVRLPKLILKPGEPAVLLGASGSGKSTILECLGFLTFKASFKSYNLSGRGVLVGIVDSGIDYENPDFRNDDGTTRIAAMWDQSISGNPPAGYAVGSEFTREDINAVLAESGFGGFPSGSPGPVLSRDTSGHGTAVAGIAAGNGRGSEGRQYRGAAPEAELIIVKMGTPRPDGFPRTTELMMGADYVMRKALDMRKPVALNISFGNTYGSHEPYC